MITILSNNPLILILQFYILSCLVTFYFQDDTENYNLFELLLPFYHNFIFLVYQNETIVQVLNSNKLFLDPLYYIISCQILVVIYWLCWEIIFSSKGEIFL